MEDLLSTYLLADAGLELNLSLADASVAKKGDSEGCSVEILFWRGIS